MSNETVNQMQQQFDSTFAAPARTYASMMLDHVEQLANLQFEATKAFAETGVKQARAALEVKDPSDVRAYIESQQNVAKELGERMKGDAEKVVSLNQAFAENAQKVTQESAQNVSQAAQDVTKTAKEEAKSTTKAASQSK
ncbi:phasin family protein [Aquisalimonas sp. APHAB1-3]|uniref:phasin family protein n=1 Tax=Aquisalimonas sp. APHAB1-3 TaxID=3402080 RepID=UPI003AAC6738